MRLSIIHLSREAWFMWKFRDYWLRFVQFIVQSPQRDSQFWRFISLSRRPKEFIAICEIRQLIKL